MERRLLTEEIPVQDGFSRIVPVSLRLLVSLACMGIVLSTACIEFEAIYQPEVGFFNKAFTVEVTVSLGAEEGPWIPAFGILLPDGWSVADSVSCTGDLTGVFVYSAEWSNAMEYRDQPSPGYSWWVGIASDTLPALPDGAVLISPEIHTGSKTGTFQLSYALGCVERIDFIRSDNHSITLDRSGMVTGTVDLIGTSDNSGVRVSAQDVADWHTYTDYSGSYELYVDPGTYTIVVQLVTLRFVPNRSQTRV